MQLNVIILKININGSLEKSNIFLIFNCNGKVYYLHTIKSNLIFCDKVYLLCGISRLYLNELTLKPFTGLFVRIASHLHCHRIFPNKLHDNSVRLHLFLRTCFREEFVENFNIYLNPLTVQSEP